MDFIHEDQPPPVYATMSLFLKGDISDKFECHRSAGMLAAFVHGSPSWQVAV
jgi:hypothetical protein